MKPSEFWTLLLSALLGLALWVGIRERLNAPAVPVAPPVPVAQKRDVLVFTATWCGPCKRLKGSLEDKAVQAELQRYNVCQLDVDANKAKAGEYRVTQVPTIVMMDRGTEIKRVTGYQSPKELLQWLR